MSFYTQARALRESGLTYEAIYKTLREGDLRPLKGIVTREKVRLACLPLHERIKSLRVQNMSLEDIVARLTSEGYTTKRGGAPSIGCVWYALNRERVLIKKRQERRA